jgi:hypothetical protein
LFWLIRQLKLLGFLLRLLKTICGGGEAVGVWRKGRRRRLGREGVGMRMRMGDDGFGEEVVSVSVVYW